MTKEESIRILKEELAKYAFKYPVLVKNLSPYLSNHYDFSLALAIVINKLYMLDTQSERLFMDIIK